LHSLPHEKSLEPDDIHMYAHDIINAYQQMGHHSTLEAIASALGSLAKVHLG
jgi:hypothetical protein